MTAQPTSPNTENRNVLGQPLEPCGTDPVTGFYRDGCCSWGVEDSGLHTICAVMSVEFLEHQRRIGNDLSTPVPQFRFPGLRPGDRWCVTCNRRARAAAGDGIGGRPERGRTPARWRGFSTSPGGESNS